MEELSFVDLKIVPSCCCEGHKDITDNFGCACGKISHKTIILIYDRCVCVCVCVICKTFSKNARISTILRFLCPGFRSSQYFLRQSSNVTVILYLWFVNVVICNTHRQFLKINIKNFVFAK